MQIGEMVAEQVILVDAQDNEIGVMEKQEAHLKGALHRAFSVFVFNPAGELLLQRRALHKYHSGGLWTNTCCSHPRPGEGNLEAAQRRLLEEMGIVCPLRHAFSFLYEQSVGTLTEHELDHVFVGTFDGEPSINPMEVAAWKPIGMQALHDDLAQNPGDYTVWFRLCLSQVDQFQQSGGFASKEITYFS